MSGARLALLGAGGHASDVLSVAESLGIHDVALVDDGNPDLQRFIGRPAAWQLMRIDDPMLEELPFVGAVGYPAGRAAMVERAVAAGLRASAALVDPSAVLHPSASVGEGSVVSGLVWGSPQIRIGAHCYVGYHARIGHDARLGDFVSLMPGAFVAGNTEIGEGATIGAGATVLQGCYVGAGAVVGAGSVVMRSVRSGATVVGVPAREVQG